METYVSNPVEIQAYQWDGTIMDAGVIVEFVQDHGGNIELLETNETPHRKHPELKIFTLEGLMTMNPRDWIIWGTVGEFYPCKPEVFAVKYHKK